MKKIIALALSVIMMASLAACGGDTSSASGTGSSKTGSSGGTALTFSWWGNQVRNERTQAALDLYTEQNPTISFDGQFAEWNDYWTKLATASASHSLPDVIQMDYKYLSQYVENDLLVDLKPYIDSGELDVSGVDPDIIEAGSIDGGIYALCIGINAPALLYNKTLLDENGITVKDNMTMEEFYAICKEVYGKTGIKTNIAYGGGESYIDYTLRSQGDELYGENSFGVDSYEEFVPYFEIYENGISEGWLVSPEIFAERSVGTVEQDPLVFGSSSDARSWCAFAFSNQLTGIQVVADNEELEVGITTWPAKNPSKANYLKPGQFLSVTKDSKKPEVAVKVLDFWTNSIECNEILLAERGVPASVPVAEALEPKLGEVEQEIIGFINNVVTPNSSPISPSAPEKSSEILKMLDTLQEKVCYKQLTAEEAAKELFDKGNAILAS